MLTHTLRHIASLIRASRAIYYHGTEMNAARKILSEGFNPDPKHKIWDETSDAPSMYGTYLSKDLAVATQTAVDAARKRKSTPVIFQVQIETRTGLSDEDELPSLSLFWTDFKQYGSAAAIPTSVLHDAISNYILNLSHDNDINPKEYQALGRQVRQFILAYAQSRFDRRDWQTDPVTRHAQDALIRTLGTSGPRFKLKKNIRVPSPIGFSGANSIISAVSINTDSVPSVLWGQPNFIDELK
jgi:hypothetical protein